MPEKLYNVEYMCTMCGLKTIRSSTAGRPDPGVCPKARTKGRPHRWVVNMKVPIGSTGTTTGRGANHMQRFMVVGGKKIPY